MADELTILLLTHRFPYGQDEQFLEAEIPFLTEHTARVIILPRNMAATVRPLPVRAEAADALAGYATGGAAKLASGLWEAVTTPHVIRELAADPSRLAQPSALVRMLGVNRVGRALSRRLLDFIRREGLDRSSMWRM